MTSLELERAEPGTRCAATLKTNRWSKGKSCPGKASHRIDGVPLCRPHAGAALLRAAETETGL